MKARVSNLFNTAAEWNKLNFIPMAGEFVVYAPDETCAYARIKVGNGISTLSELPFFTDECIASHLTAYDKAALADAGNISSYLTV